MKNESGKRAVDVNKLLSRVKDDEYCYLTTTGRISGQPHEVEIWFGIQDNTLYLLSGGRDKSDWVKNLLKNPSVTVRIGKHTLTGTARIVIDEKEDKMTRPLLDTKYQQWSEGRRLSKWARTALPVAINFNQGE